MCSIFACFKGWLPEVAAVIWRRVMGLLGDINDVQQPDIHQTYMNNLAHIVDSLLKIRDNQGVSLDGCPSPSLYPSFIPPVDFVLPWLFEAFALPEHYAASQRLALEMICRVFVRRHEGKWSEEHLLAFYSTVHQALISSDLRLTATAISGTCPGIFALPTTLPGSWILIQDYVTAARRILQSTSAMVPLPAKIKAAQLLGTLISLTAPAETDDGHISVLNVDGDDDDIHAPLSHDSLCMQIMQGLISCTSLEYPVPLRCTALQCLGQLFFRALNRAPPSPSEEYTTFYSTIFHTVLYQLSPTDPQVSLTVLESLYPLLDIPECLVKKFPSVPVKLVEMLASALAETLSALRPSPGPPDVLRPAQMQLAGQLLIMMADWVTRLPLDVLVMAGREEDSQVSDIFLAFCCFKILQATFLKLFGRNYKCLVDMLSSFH